jgi:hypothetical protein
MKYIISKTEAFRPYFGMGEYDPTMYCRDLYTLFDVSCVEISEPLFDTLYPTLPVGYEEITKDEAMFGSQFFSEIRDTVKILDPNTLMADTLAMPDHVKIPFTMTEEIRGHIIQFMYRLAKEVIEQEYNHRFKVLKNTSDLEEASWAIQKHEAAEWLQFQGADGHVTPFLDYLAIEHGKDKTELATKILEKSEAWSDKLSTMLVEQQKLLKEFKNVASVKEMNIVYEKYFGIMMPISQAQELGLANDLGDRIFELDGDTYYDTVNPSLGHKFNF